MPSRLSRRAFVATSAAAALAGSALPRSAAAANRKPVVQELVAGSAEKAFGRRGVLSQVLAYNGSVPGPVLRSRRGAELHVKLRNALNQPTSVHWHGLRVPIGQDGVPYVTQAPVRPGETFDYRFRTEDAGTFFYHPHINSVEQVGRGLFGALIVEESVAPEFDRDDLWVISDWSLNDLGVLDRDFDNFHDRSHAGRYGNLVTVNGESGAVLKARANERVRLRLVNAATGRMLALDFGALAPWLIALDGQPVAPRRAAAGDLLLGPGMRADLAIDLPAAPGKRFAVVDRYDRDPFVVASLEVMRDKPARGAPLARPKALRPNAIATPNLSAAERLDVVFGGGAMAGMMGRGGMMGMGPANMMGMARQGRFWAVNGRFEPPLEQGIEPLFKLRRNRSYILSLVNRTAFDHPIHLHGHVFQVLSDGGRKLPVPILRDSVTIRPRGTTEIAFVADNPGDWMFHCHILSHQVSGMMSVVRVE